LGEGNAVLGKLKKARDVGAGRGCRTQGWGRAGKNISARKRLRKTLPCCEGGGGNQWLEGGNQRRESECGGEHGGAEEMRRFERT